MRFVHILLLILIVATACNSSNKEPKTQTLRVNLFSEPPTLDPRKAVDITSVNILLALFEGLTRIGPNDKPEPALAEKITISKDKLTYTFHLRPSFWSNQDPVTAYDFLYSWRKILDPKFPSPLAYKLFIIKNAMLVKQGKLPVTDLGVVAPDAKTLVVQLEHPSPSFLELLSFAVFYPVHSNSEADETSFYDGGEKFISNGPFNLVSWDHDTKITLAKNPLYWDEKAVILSSIDMVMVDDTTTEFHMYEMNELDWAGSPLSNLPVEVVPSLQQEGTLISTPLLAVYYYKMNVEAPPLHNQNIRKALSYAIDRDAIVTHILQSGEKPALSLVPLQNHTYFKDHDLSRAKELFDLGMKELGLTKTNFPPLKISFNSNREHQKIATAISQQWQQTFGIEASLEHCDWKVYLSKLNQRDYQIARMGWIEDCQDPLSFLEPFKYKDEGPLGNNNNTGWANPKFTDLLDKAERSVDPEIRANHLIAAEKILMEEMPVIPIYFLTSRYVKKAYVQGVYLSSGGIIDFKRASIKQSK